MLLITSAVNAARAKSDIFGRELNLKKNGITAEIKLFVDKLNEDWWTVYKYFEPMMNFLYSVGKQEKMSCTTQSEWKGILY